MISAATAPTDASTDSAPPEAPLPPTPWKWRFGILVGLALEIWPVIMKNRTPLSPVAMEGALKLKEISYIHAEAYPAGELKHGPLALVDKEMPVVAIAPNDALLEKLKSNMQEVRARGGELYVFADRDAKIASADRLRTIALMDHAGPLSPILHVIPLQLLAYHTALAKGTDVDKPRNLAKSVTVE